MKNYPILFIVTTILVIKTPACAQTCYSPITSWRGTYNLTGIGSGPDAAGGYNWTIDHQIKGIPYLSTSDVSCSTALWYGYDFSASGSVNDKGTGSCPDGSSRTQ